MILSSFYFHIKKDISKSEQEPFRKYLNENIHGVAKVLFRQDVEINIEIEEGSIKVWIKVLGFLCLGISHYGAFRAGVDQIIEDSKMIKSVVIEFLIKDGTHNEDILESKKVNSVPEELRKLTLKIDRLEINYRKNDDERNKKEIKSIMMLLERILACIDNKKDFEFIINGIKSDILPDLNQFDFDKRKHQAPIKTKYETQPTLIEEKKKHLIDKRRK